jgi:arabinogalactan endo-1,4-beta-galactosidase
MRALVACAYSLNANQGIHRQEKDTVKRLILTFTALFLSACGGAVAPTSTTTVVSTTTTTSSIAVGADVGWLTQLESLGYNWADPSGTSEDALQILKNHGVNTIRIRTFVNPAIAAGTLGVGNNDQAGSIALATLANSMGFQIMIDFHYSDTWADPGHQTMPAAWASESYAQVETSVYHYTFNFMTALAAAGVTPKWVQVGNEIDGGMLWPIGSYANFSQLTGLINNGYAAVKVVSPTTQVVVHLSTISDLSHFESFFDSLVSNGGRFDVIGGSYYDGPTNLTTVASNLNTLAARYSKPVMICEIGHTSSDVSGSSSDIAGAISAMKAVPNQQGLGVIYWEPEAPNDATTDDYTMGVVTENSGKVLQFTSAIGSF